MHLDWLDLLVALAAGVLLGLVVGLLVQEGGAVIEGLTDDVKPEPATGKE
jgi:hypothetical protein